MSVHADYNRNGHLVFWDTHRKRIVNVIGPDVIGYDLVASDLNADPLGWTTTVVEVGAGTTEFDPSNSEGLIGTITTAANENDGGSYQLLGENYIFDADHHIYLAAQIQINDADQTDFLIGLGITDTTPLGGISDAVYFESLDGSTDISIVSEKNSTETTGGTTGTLVDATLIYLEYYWDGTALEAFIDGASIYLATPANVPDDEALRPTIHFLTGEAVANTCAFARFKVRQWGRS